MHRLGPSWPQPYALLVGLSRSLVRAVLALLLVLGVWAEPGRAALDAEVKTPYRLQVVLHIEPHRFLTPLFQEQLHRELRDGLGLELGALAQVEVVRQHPLLSDILTRGLQQSLDRFEPGGSQQVHFVVLRYAEGRYHLYSRAYDGPTGQVAALVRHVETSDRAEVGNLAQQLVGREFGPEGTVTSVAKDVQVTLKAGDLGVPLARWVKPGAVFSVSRVVSDGQRQRATRMPWALLQVIETASDGTCRCRYWHRYQEDRLHAPTENTAFRCWRLPTVQGPLRVRLLEDETLQPLDGVQVRATQPGGGRKVDVTTDRDGLASTAERFDGMALVQVLQGEAVRAQFPVAILDDRPVACRVKVHADAENVASLEFRRDAWVRRIYDDIRLAGERVAELNKLLGQSLEKALSEARSGLKNQEAELEQLQGERGALSRLATERKVPLDLREGEQKLTELHKRQKELQGFVSRVEQVIKEAASEKTQQLAKSLERARLLEGEADYEGALRLYKAVLDERPDQPKVREHFEQLQQEWTIHSPEHAEARAFIYKTWPTLDVAGLKANVDKARKAVETCLAVGDLLTPRKLLVQNAVHASNLKRQLEALRRQDTEDNRNQARALAPLANSLRQLHSDVTAALEKQEKRS